MTDVPRSEEALHRAFLVRQILQEVDRYRDLADCLARFANQAEAPRQVFAAEFYTSIAAQVVKEINTAAFNANLSGIITSAGQADVARAKGV